MQNAQHGRSVSQVFRPSRYHVGCVFLGLALIASSMIRLSANDPPMSAVERAGEREGSDSSWERLAPLFELPAGTIEIAKRYRSPLLFSNGQVVRSREDWARRRDEILQQWNSLLGQWPALIEDPRVEVLGREVREGIEQQTIRFLWAPNQQTTGYLLLPPGSEKKPAVVTVYYEPESSIGLGKPQRDYGWLLAREGFVVLSIGTTEATENSTYAIYYPSIEESRVEPLSMLAYAAANAWYLLASREEVDSSRIGIVGHSFGGKWAMFASCLFDRFACAAWSDPGIMFDDTRSNINYWEPWYLGYHPKPWRARGLITPENPAHGSYPQLRKNGRDLHEIHALMAPRPFFVSGGEEDPPSRWGALWHSVEVNRILGFDHRVGMHNRPEHNPSEEANQRVVDFFVHFLKECATNP